MPSVVEPGRTLTIEVETNVTERVPRSEFMEHLRDCLRDRTGFCADLNGLLRTGEEWDADAAGTFIEQLVLARLPE